MEQDFIEKIKTAFELPEVDMRTYSPLTLAYIGDCIYELVIRTMLVGRGNAQVNHLHSKASRFVKAVTQKDIFRAIEDLLTEEETAIYKRGRNAKSFTTAKNASVTDYRIATGFEALMGWLYLKKDTDRIIFLVKEGLVKLGMVTVQ